MSRVTREDLVEQSVSDYVRNAIFVERGYPPSQVEMSEAFPYTRTSPLDKNHIVTGFNYDNDGEQAEMGSDLMRRIYTLEFFVFGTAAAYARNLANAIKFAIEREPSIPLKNYGVDGAPEIDRLVVVGASADHQVVPDPEPWQEFVWLTTCQVEDVYYAALV